MLERSCQTPADLALILALAHRVPDENLHVIDLPYRLCSWALDEPGNTRLWFGEDGSLRAWAVLQAPFWSIDYVFDPPGSRDLHLRILDWAAARAGHLRGDPIYGRLSWFINVLEGQNGRMEDLQARGFADQIDAPVDPWSQVLMARPGEEDCASRPLPPGFRLRELDGAAEVEAYVDLHRAVFQSKNMTPPWRARVIRQPACLPELNLCIEAPNGELAGFCIGWFDPSAYAGTPCGQIEPLGVREDQRGRGLAQALLGECIRRLRALGAAQIFVETDNFATRPSPCTSQPGSRCCARCMCFGEIFEGLKFTTYLLQLSRGKASAFARLVKPRAHTITCLRLAHHRVMTSLNNLRDFPSFF